MIGEGADNDRLDSKYTKCPCSSFQSPQHVISALSSFEKTQRLIEWIQGFHSPTDEGVNFFEKGPSSSEPQNCRGVEKNSHRCKWRVGAAYCVLNAIRDASRIFLEKEQYFTNNDVTQKERNVVSNSSQGDSQSYEEAFPSLQSIVCQSEPTILKQKHKKNEFVGNSDGLLNIHTSRLRMNNQDKRSEVKVKVKRRITPATVKTEESNAWGNISSLPNSDNALSDTFRNATTTTTTTTTTTSLESMISNPCNIRMNKIISDDEVAFANATKQQNNTAGNFMKAPLSLESQKVSKHTHIVEKIVPTSLPKYPDETEILMNNTVRVYCAIIQTQLVPSVAVELQLMLRLLSVTGEISPINPVKTSKGQSLANLLIDHHCCRQFAVQVLTKLKYLILNMDQEILIKLLGIRVFVDLIPQVAKEIRRSLEFRRTALLSKGEGPQEGRHSGLVSGMNTILTLPFQQERDSRHNYQSRELTSMYNNREKCRDTFLSQLRAFQQMRITMMDPIQIHRAFDQIKVSLLRLKSELLPSNINWFVEFFTELLLQIGLIPMQELDDDILKNVADKQRLQKLHSRFTSKVAQKNKSTKPLILTDSAPNSNSSPDHHFTGHQEFFFIFINTVDSHSFSDHLKRRLVHIILTKTSCNETKDIELRINQLKMLAKFLGMLIFSPNWYIEDISITGTENLRITTPTVPINAIIQEACNNGKLIIVLPWILSYLWMMSWDRASMKLPYYKDTFGILRNVHKSIMNVVFEECSNLARNLFLIGLQLDLFFSEVVGLSEIDRQEEWRLSCPAYNRHRDTLDASLLIFSRQYLVSTSLHFDDLFKLVTELESNGRLTSNPGVSKKLRPQSISNFTKDLLSSSTSERFDTLDSFEFDQLQEFMSQPPFIKGLKIQSKLVDKFFHQHKRVNQICEFVITYSIENIISKSWLEDHLSPIVEQIVISSMKKANVTHPVDFDWYYKTMQIIEREVWVVANYNPQKILKDYILKAMDGLIPFYVDKRIKDVATTLAIDHALKKGNVQTISVIRFKTKQVMDTLLDDCKTALNNPCHKHLSTCHTTLGISLLKDINELTEKLETSYISLNTLSENAFHSVNYSNKIRYICKNLKSYKVDACLSVSVTKLVQALTKIINLWVDKESIRSEINGSEINGKFFQDVVDLASVLSSQGLIFNDCFVLGSLISTPLVLKSLFTVCTDVSWINEKIIRNVLMKRIELLQGLTGLLESHLISQDTSSLVILLLNDMHKCAHCN